MGRMFRFGVVVVGLLTMSRAEATPYTPLEWQREVGPQGHHALRGQRKHIGWVRDTNANFVDDALERRIFAHSHLLLRKVDVIVDLNHCLPSAQIKTLLSKYGKVSYIGKLITFVLLDGVKREDVAKIAALPDVAMVEMQLTGHTATDQAAATIHARPPQVPNTITGAGINIAILDTGVDDATHNSFLKMGGVGRKFVDGYDAETQFLVTDGSNPADADAATKHGTGVAAAALGSDLTALTGTPCRVAGGKCTGIAPGAGLVDVKVCRAANNCPASDVTRGIDWVGVNHETRFDTSNNVVASPKIKIVNASFSFCDDDDGHGAIAEQMNYLASIGIIVVASMGDSNNPACTAGPKPGQPGTASLAITVTGQNENGNSDRDNDTPFSLAIPGPRRIPSFMSSQDASGLKPELSAPAEGVFTASGGGVNNVATRTSASIAAAITSGTVALVLDAGIQNGKGFDPGGMKDLLLKTAYRNPLHNALVPGPVAGVFGALWDNWLPDRGLGKINAEAAVAAAVAGTIDISFPTCTGTSPPGTICPRNPIGQPWNNDSDITVVGTMQRFQTVQLTAQVKNPSPTTDVDVTVNFGVYEFGTGTARFHHIGSKRQTIIHGTNTAVTIPWYIEFAGHQCVQVSIDYGDDKDSGNNTTQRNMEASASFYTVRVENPFMRPARFEVEVKSKKDGWGCKIKNEDKNFTLDPFECPRHIEIGYDAPLGAREGEQGDCELSVKGGPIVKKGKPELKAMGGVTMRTLVPKPCRLVGMVLDEGGAPLEGVTLEFKPARSGRYGTMKAVTDSDGIFDIKGTPIVLENVVVEKQGVKGSVTFRPQCGARQTIVFGKKGNARLADQP